MIIDLHAVVCLQTKVEQLAADWKALDGQMRETLQAQISPWTQREHLVQHQQLGKDAEICEEERSLMSESNIKHRKMQRPAGFISHSWQHFLNPCLKEFPCFSRRLLDLTSVSAVPSAVQMASLVSEDPHHQTPHSPDSVAPTDLNETATELANWLLLITQMLKSNIVTVGDVEEIRTTMGRLQVGGEEQASVADVTEVCQTCCSMCFLFVGR